MWFIVNRVLFIAHFPSKIAYTKIKLEFLGDLKLRSTFFLVVHSKVLLHLLRYGLSYIGKQRKFNLLWKLEV